MGATGMTSTVRGAVLGSPVSHSLSPLLHRSIFSHLNLQLDYQAIEVSGGSLDAYLKENEDLFDYLSLTMPFKEEVHETLSNNEMYEKLSNMQ